MERPSRLLKITAFVLLEIPVIGFAGNTRIGPSQSQDLDLTRQVFGPPVPERFIDKPTATPTEVPTLEPIITPTAVPEWTPQSGENQPWIWSTFEPNISEPPSINIEAGQDLEFAQEIFNETNGARAGFGLPAYSFSRELTAAAQKYSEFLASRFEQGLPIGHFEDGNPQERALREGYEGGIAENINGDKLLDEFNSGKYWVDKWLGSPGHRANILSNVSKDLGVGCAIAYQKLNPYDSILDYTRICVQKFGQRYEWDGTPGPTVVPTATPRPTPTPVPTIRPTPTPEATATATPEPTPTNQP